MTANLPFLLSALVAVWATFMVVTRAVAIHALLYLVVALLALACVFDVLGAPFAAILEVIVYAGAIMVLFVFVVMMLNLGRPDSLRENTWIAPRIWIGPGLLAALLLAALADALVMAAPGGGRIAVIDTRQVGLALYGPYVLMVELASFLLLAGLVSAFRIGRHIRDEDAP
ncbi:NADH-quinone oxidoreductase subunit J [Gluconacetobacter azotocaptans]|uniref:NADH-quinone oxidoreductase subunit J n=1 Tax=Gluconacetobacter azotocaptans TaxID=142834 RepID=A0A7W4JQ61_9PROT|nr:NADH-quinone oxidoreductase subunit J [Gluconacetobacter azotocaptans]MBB2188899.1 NADH-quinone oxidoreductase subunit J [Gluconacetobacter azotocaptans]MBM9401668.1 NADH-quinone oxidoreductase subunit J [Gluconacetobacter azotocaptans]GBQ31016.1 NADH-quinone oxidoreductase chain J [Gluconacetobacter azotocaptans DSM 13594]